MLGSLHRLISFILYFGLLYFTVILIFILLLVKFISDSAGVDSGGVAPSRVIYNLPNPIVPKPVKLICERFDGCRILKGKCPDCIRG